MELSRINGQFFTLILRNDELAFLVHLLAEGDCF